MKGTVEERIIQLQNWKRNLCNCVTGDVDAQVSNSLGYEELKMLFSVS